MDYLAHRSPFPCLMVLSEASNLISGYKLASNLLWSAKNTPFYGIITKSGGKFHSFFPRPAVPPHPNGCMTYWVKEHHGEGKMDFCSTNPVFCFLSTECPGALRLWTRRVARKPGARETAVEGGAEGGLLLQEPGTDPSCGPQRAEDPSRGTGSRIHFGTCFSGRNLFEADIKIHCMNT